MKNIILILGLLLSILKANGQVITIVQYEYQADINVYICDYKYMADIIVHKTDNKNKAENKAGYWYWGDRNRDKLNPSNLNVFFVRYKYQADYSVYFGNEYEIKVTTEYLNEL